MLIRGNRQTLLTRPALSGLCVLVCLCALPAMSGCGDGGEAPATDDSDTIKQTAAGDQSSSTTGIDPAEAVAAKQRADTKSAEAQRESRRAYRQYYLAQINLAPRDWEA